MLDIKFIRENPEIVKKAMKDKNRKSIDIGKIVTLYDERKLLRTQLEELYRRRNIASEARDTNEGKRVKEEVQKEEEKLHTVEKELRGLLLLIPNIPSPDTPVGPDETANQVLYQIGEKPAFSFKPKPHWDIGRDLDIIDNERAAKVSGARFTYLKRDLALLEFALISFALKILTDASRLNVIKEEFSITVSVAPFIPIIPPVMVRPEMMQGMARLDPPEDKYFIESDNLFLTGSAEHALGPMHAGETFSEEDLPVRYAGFSTSFRREAGSYGKDTRGILRMHQFDKMEMETFCLPEQSRDEQDFLVAVQEYIMQQLKLPYQVVAVSTGDMGFPDHRQIDIETWMPGQNTYRETHSADLIGGFQSRRLNIRTRRSGGKTEYVHMNDATVLAMGRTLIAILENYQEKDGTVRIPVVLQEYLGKDRIEHM